MRTTDWPEQAAFIARIDELMRRDGIRHDTALAEAAGISHTAISNWKRGKVKPSLKLLTAVAKVFNEPPSALAKVAGLLGDDDVTETGEPLPAEIEQLGRLYREADDDRRAELLRQVDVVIHWFESTGSMERRPRNRRAS